MKTFSLFCRQIAEFDTNNTPIDGLQAFYNHIKARTKGEANPDFDPNSISIDLTFANAKGNKETINNVSPKDKKAIRAVIRSFVKRKPGVNTPYIIYKKDGAEGICCEVEICENEEPRWHILRASNVDYSDVDYLVTILTELDIYDLYALMS